MDGTGLGNTEFVFEDNTTSKWLHNCSEDRGCVAEGFEANNALKKVSVGNTNEEGLTLKLSDYDGSYHVHYIEEIYLSPNSTIDVGLGKLYYKRLTMSPGSSIVGYSLSGGCPGDTSTG